MSLSLDEYGVTGDDWKLFTRNQKKKISQAYNRGNMYMLGKLIASALAGVDERTRDTTEHRAMTEPLVNLLTIGL